MTHSITLSTVYLALAAGVVLPNLTALLTARMATSRYKALVLAVLSVVAGAVQQVLANHGTFVPKTLALWAGVTFMTSVVTHYGLLKPLGLTGSAGTVARTLPGGIGGKTAAARAAAEPNPTGMAR
jgi:general stress protein CsbA